MDDRERVLRLAAVGEVAAGLAHELRNVLQTIAMGVYLLEKEHGPSPRLGTLERQARLGLDLVERALAMGRGDVLAPERVPFADVLREARDGLPEGITFVDSYPQDLEVPVDLVLFGRLLHVLYENAAHVGGDGGVRVETRAHATPEGFAVTVEDDGPGVPPPLVDTLFEPFVTGRPGGTGVGLALARRIARAHGGNLELVSPDERGGGGEREGPPSPGGAMFRVTLPAHARSSRPPASAGSR